MQFKFLPLGVSFLRKDINEMTFMLKKKIIVEKQLTKI